MAKQFLGKEVVAAVNSRIMADVAALKEKGVTPTLGIVPVSYTHLTLPTICSV